MAILLWKDCTAAGMRISSVDSLERSEYRTDRSGTALFTGDNPVVTSSRFVGRVRAEYRLSGLASWRALVRLVNSQDLTHAAAIAYYALLSLFPLILLGLSVLGEMTADSADRDAVVRFAFRYFPGQFAFIQGQLDAFREAPVAFGFWGVVALVWASLGVFNAVSSAVNHAWGVEKRRSFLRHRLVSFVMMLSAGGILILGLIIASLVRLAETRLERIQRRRHQGVLGIGVLERRHPAHGLAEADVGLSVERRHLQEVHIEVVRNRRRCCRLSGHGSGRGRKHQQPNQTKFHDILPLALSSGTR